MNKTARQLEKKYSKGVISEACEFFETYGKHCTIDELFEMCERINGNNSRRRNICRLFSRIKRDKQVRKTCIVIT